MSIFISNKYTKIYTKIINRALIRNTPSCYTEKHHILPKSLGGTDDDDNMAILTAREHFICHCLLPKMLTDGKSISKMLCAIRRLKNGKTEKFTSRLYELYKPKIVEAHKSMVKGKPQRKRTKKEREAQSIRVNEWYKSRGKENKGYKKIPHDEWLDIRRNAMKKCQGSVDKKTIGTLISVGKLKKRKKYTPDERINLTRGKIERFVPILINHYGYIDDVIIKSAKDDGIIPSRSCISEKSLMKVYGKIPKSINEI